ncbi:MAG: glutamate--tRNA ligase [Rickettsiales bacterium]|nr:glutamate--tRNA ligase [Rickettsiales bacterium]
MSVNVRFAPSPTGYLHIGGARTALFNYLFARKYNGQFLLRIEDTDKKRSTKEAIAAILEGMEWLGLQYDGEKIFQSNNEKRHRQIADELLAKGLAYRCYTSGEELANKRQEYQEQGKVFRFQSPWRDKEFDGDDKASYVVRIKAPQEGEMEINDLVQGKVVVKNEEIDDFVILRADGTPTYMLAVVVDDHDMDITHIIRGDDHLNNTFKQKLIYDLLGWDCPKFAHIPLIHGVDGAKMSKRHGATSVIEYKNMGYLPEAMRNYLLRLGFSCGDLEMMDDKKALEVFDLSKVGKSAARFDFAKLNNVNKHYMVQKNAEELVKLSKAFFTRDFGEIEVKRMITAVEFVKERCDNLVDLAKNLEVYCDGFAKDLEEKEQHILQQNSDIISQLKAVVSGLEKFDVEEIKTHINSWAEKNGLKMKDFGPVLRVLMTFSSKSAGGIFDIMSILGKEETLRRF